ncbi:hypothetical protein D3C77_720680 [compost metagenome]
MPMKVASMAKSSPQAARLGTAWPKITPTRVHSCQFRYMARAAPKKYQCLCGDSSFSA